jgi:MoxR-like ATPase
VLATQNPLENGQGVYPLTNANRDRFAVGITMPEQDEEVMLAVEAKVEAAHRPAQVVEIEALSKVKSALSHVVVPSNLKRDAAGLVVAVRKHKDVHGEQTVLGGGRPLLKILNLARYVALSDRRQRQKIEATDVAFAARYVLPHRIGLHFDQYDKTTAQEIVEQVIDKSL